MSIQDVRFPATIDFQTVTYDAPNRAIIIHTVDAPPVPPMPVVPPNPQKLTTLAGSNIHFKPDLTNMDVYGTMPGEETFDYLGTVGDFQAVILYVHKSRVKGIV